MKKHFLLTKTLLVALLCLVGQSVWAQTTTTLAEYGTNDVPWTAEKVAEWTAGGSPTLADGVVTISGSNGSYSTSKTISPTANAIINVTAVWRGASSTGRYFSNGNCSYFRFGNIVVAQNDQDQKHGYVLTGLGNASSVTTFIAGSYRVEVTSSTWLKIEAEINTAENILKSFTIKSEDGTTTYVSLSNQTLTSPDYTTVAFGYQKGGGVSTTNKEQLKSVKITQTTQAVTNVSYTINYKLGDNLVKSVSSTGIVNQVISADVAVDGTETGYEGKHYLITANEAPSMTLVATAASNVLNVPVRAPYTATLTVTRSVGGVAETPVVTNLTETDAKVCSWSYAYPMYVKKDDVYYIADVTSSFGETGTFTDGQSISKSVTYTNIDPLVVYFGEPNETAGNNVAYSNGNTGYITGGVTYEKDDVIRLGVLPAGTYRLITNVTGNANRYVVVGNCTDTSEFPTALVTITTTGAKDELFTLAAATPISISGKDQGSGKFNQSADVDYILVKKAGVPATLGTNGYATFASPYALDLTTANLPSDVTAYKASVSGTTVTFTALDQTVPANTGVLLKGTGTVNIPVAATGTAVEGNDFLVNNGGATFTGDDSYYYFGLVKDLDPLTFRKFVPSTTAIPADKAYLKVLKSSVDATARGLEFVFDDEVTGVNEVRVKNLTPALSQGEGAWYDLQGRKVAQPQKGLYIVNGKKVVLK